MNLINDYRNALKGISHYVYNGPLYEHVNFKATLSALAFASMSEYIS